MEHYDEQKEDYLSLCDEMNDYDAPEWVEGDWDERAVKSARTYARKHGLPFPPGKGDFDRMFDRMNNEGI